MSSLSVVMPAFDEADNLPRVVPEVLAVCRKVRPGAFEIVIVDDGSSDRTPEVLRELGKANPEVRTITHERNRGLTAALRTGFFAAARDFVIFIPADGQFPAEQLVRFLEAAPGHDLVLSRYSHRPDGALRLVLSRGLRILLWIAIGFGDRLEGPYLFRRSLLDRFNLVSERSAGSIGFEIAAKTRQVGGGIATITVDCSPRLSGTSKVANARNIREYLGEIARIRRSMR